jgi:hypothetical protein
MRCVRGQVQNIRVVRPELHAEAPNPSMQADVKIRKTSENSSTGIATIVRLRPYFEACLLSLYTLSVEASAK